MQEKSRSGPLGSICGGKLTLLAVALAQPTDCKVPSRQIKHYARLTGTTLFQPLTSPTMNRFVCTMSRCFCCTELKWPIQHVHRSLLTRKLARWLSHVQQMAMDLQLLLQSFRHGAQLPFHIGRRCFRQLHRRARKVLKRHLRLLQLLAVVLLQCDITCGASQTAREESRQRPSRQAILLAYTQTAPRTNDHVRIAAQREIWAAQELNERREKAAFGGHDRHLWPQCQHLEAVRRLSERRKVRRLERSTFLLAAAPFASVCRQTQARSTSRRAKCACSTGTERSEIKNCLVLNVHVKERESVTTCHWQAIRRAQPTAGPAPRCAPSRLDRLCEALSHMRAQRRDSKSGTTTQHMP